MREKSIPISTKLLPKTTILKKGSKGKKVRAPLWAAYAPFWCARHGQSLGGKKKSDAIRIPYSRCGGYGMKDIVLTWGDLQGMLLTD